MSPERRRARRVPAAVASKQADRPAGSRPSFLPRVPFPLIFAFCVGAMVMFVAGANVMLTQLMFMLCLFGTSYGLARILTRWIVMKRMGPR